MHILRTVPKGVDEALSSAQNGLEARLVRTVSHALAPADSLGSMTAIASLPSELELLNLEINSFRQEIVTWPP